MTTVVEVPVTVRSDAAALAEPLKRGDACTVVIFGAAGDLARRKLFPALFHLQCDGLLHEDFALVGVARGAMTDDAFRRLVYEAARDADDPSPAGEIDEAAWARFAPRLSYVPGDFTAANTYNALGERLGAIDQPPREDVALLPFEMLPPRPRESLEHPEAAGFPAPHQALVDERLQELEVGVADSLRGLERPAAAKDGQRCQQSPLLGVEQLVRPVDRGTQGALARLRVPSAAEQVEASAETLQQLCRGEQRRPRCRELECQREVVEPLAQLVDEIVGVEVGVCCRGARHEQLARLRPSEHRHRIDLLALQAQALPAGHEHIDARAGGQQGRDLRRGRNEVLEVVEQQKQPPIADELRERAAAAEDARGSGADDRLRR